MQIFRLAAFSDNYIFLLFDPQHKIAAVVDPGELQPVLDCLDNLKARLVAILNTHHHFDHIGANQELIKYFPQAIVYGGEVDRGRIPQQQVFLQDGDGIQFGDHKGRVLWVPGHTRGHIAYYFPPDKPEDPGELFCGDTLFSGGCGRLFEGTPAQMVDSLNKLRMLPDDTRIWCAHEYTLNNLKFALTVDPQNLDLHQRWREVQAAYQRGQPTIPSWLSLEKQTNPFLRWDTPAIQSAMGLTSPTQTFARLRKMKDKF